MLFMKRLSSTPRFSGVGGALVNPNRFSGLGAESETAKAVRPNNRHFFSSLKRGVNETSDLVTRSAYKLTEPDSSQFPPSI